MNQTVIIRKETPEDYEPVFQLTEKADNFMAIEFTESALKRRFRNDYFVSQILIVK